MGRGPSYTPQQNAATAAATATQRQAAADRAGDSAKMDTAVGDYRGKVMDIWKQNPWQDPAYLTNVRSKAASVASGTEKASEEAINEGIKRTGGLNSGSSTSSIEEMRREKTRELHDVLTNTAIADKDKYEALKEFGTAALGQIPDWYTKKYGTDSALQGSALATQGNVANNPAIPAQPSLWGSIIGAGGALGAAGIMI